MLKQQTVVLTARYYTFKVSHSKLSFDEFNLLFQFLHHRRKQFSEIQASFRDEDRNFLYVWFVLYVIRVWGTLRCFIYFAIPTKANAEFMEVLLYLQAVGDPLQAFCNSILFCICDKTVRRELWCCICCTRAGEREHLLGAETDQVTQNN